MSFNTLWLLHYAYSAWTLLKQTGKGSVILSAEGTANRKKWGLHDPGWPCMTHWGLQQPHSRIMAKPISQSPRKWQLSHPKLKKAMAPPLLWRNVHPPNINPNKTNLHGTASWKEKHVLKTTIAKHIAITSRIMQKARLPEYRFSCWGLQKMKKETT